MERNITSELMKWKSDPNKVGLIVEGARQVGKTYIIREFGKKNYEHFLELNFHDRDKCKIFSDDRSAQSIIDRLSYLFNDFKVVKGKSLLFLDEIQDCPEAIMAIKPLVNDGRLDVIASGSMLGIHYRAPRSYPLGYTHVIRLNPMTFDEYLIAIGFDRGIIENIGDHVKTRTPFDRNILESLNSHFRQYVQIGGMPQAVKTYITGKDMNSVFSIHEDIINDYRKDIVAYSDKKFVGEITNAFNLIPLQLSRESKRFRFNDISDDTVGRFERLKEPLFWISGSRFINVCFCLNSIEHPLNAHIEQDKFKNYMGDTGLLMQMYGEDTRDAISMNDYSVNKGAIAENVVLQMILACNHPVFYYTKNEEKTTDEKKGDSKPVRMEIDFITSLGSELVAIEVKSGKKRKAKSLKTLRETAYGKKVTRFIKFSEGNIHVDENGVEHYPMFCAAFVNSMYEPIVFERPVVDNDLFRK